MTRSAKDLIVWPNEAIVAVQKSETCYQVKRQKSAESARLFIHPEPHVQKPQHEINYARGQSIAEIDISDFGFSAADRPYFSYYSSSDKPNANLGELLAARILRPFSYTNLRDIGGYVTKDGQVVRWGRIFRSGDLSNINDEDQLFLQRLNIRKVFDLRTKEEAERRPNGFPRRQFSVKTRRDGHLLSNPQPVYVHAPIYERSENRASWLRTLIFRKSKVERFWIEGVYIDSFLTKRAAAFGQMINVLAEADNQPAIVHCTAGKDRTGLVIALLLHILGVPEKTIFEDYSLSNLYYDEIAELVRADRERLAIFGVKAKDLFPFLTADPNVLVQCFNHLKSQYGSIERYLIEVAHVSPDAIDKLRGDLLTNRTKP